MSNRFTFLVLATTMAIAAVATAQEPAPTTSPETTKPEQKLVCKRERSTGSNMVKKVCRTEAQIAAEREAARQGMETNDNRCMQGASCKGG